VFFGCDVPDRVVYFLKTLLSELLEGPAVAILKRGVPTKPTTKIRKADILYSRMVRYEYKMTRCQDIQDVYLIYPIKTIYIIQIIYTIYTIYHIYYHF